VSFQPGDIVNVRIVGARYEGAGDDGPRFRTADGAQILYVRKEFHAIVERSAPEGWPPQIGDIWCDRDGAEWIARGQTDGSLTFIPIQYESGKILDSPDGAAHYHGPMTLVRRAGGVPDSARES
jgi:hypothetical protein